MSLAIQKVASDHVGDATVSVVSLPSDDMKGRIIGREGRNIRAIEQFTGVDLIIDDTPEAVILSCFNPVRREIAKISLERLLADGRIHPARIEETVKRVEEEFDQIEIENGEQVCFELGITDLPSDLLKKLGKLKYLTSGQQSVLNHSLEVAQITATMAAELGLDVKFAKRCGLLHDIGKAVDQSEEGTHGEVGAKICESAGESDKLCEAIRLHHSADLKDCSAYAVILHAANLLSASRPGARKEALASYINRLSDMGKES